MSHSLTIQDYSIYFVDQLGQVVQLFDLKPYSQLVILVDENTRAYCLPHVLSSIPDFQHAIILEIPAGEEWKSIDTCKQLWQSLMELEADRKALMINLGGGVIGDMGGFVASTYKRGIDFINFPTTLLSQVDATVGGKLGVNFSGIKNSVGLFNNPRAVFICPVFLKTLPEKELTSGFAEMVKHSLISASDKWTQIKTACLPDRQAKPLNGENDWGKLIESSLQVKLAIVEADPYEQGQRKVLNFGHTLGHAFESYALEMGKPILHGHAVALGMVGESYLSHKLVGLPVAELDEIVGYLGELYRQYFDKEMDINKLLGLMRNDKKNENNRVNFTLLRAIGHPVIDQLLDEKNIVDALEYMKTNL